MIDDAPSGRTADDPSCECSHYGQSHPYSAHTDEGCTEYDSYGLPCTCPGSGPTGTLGIAGGDDTVGGGPG
ncbi:hypothetical protein [Plantactinospora endophytica]|nr:hypothetical protein [Plantactinospora endophytica]